MSVSQLNSDGCWCSIVFHCCSVNCKWFETEFVLPIHGYPWMCFQIRGSLVRALFHFQGGVAATSTCRRKGSGGVLQYYSAHVAHSRVAPKIEKTFHERRKQRGQWPVFSTSLFCSSSSLPPSLPPSLLLSSPSPHFFHPPFRLLSSACLEFPLPFPKDGPNSAKFVLSFLAPRVEELFCCLVVLGWRRGTQNPPSLPLVSNSRRSVAWVLGQTGNYWRHHRSPTYSYSNANNADKDTHLRIREKRDKEFAVLVFEMVTDSANILLVTSASGGRDS